MVTSPEFTDLKWVPPKSYSPGRPDHQCPSTGKFYKGEPRFITIHYTAGAEGPTSAEDGAAYDQRRTDSVSSHFYVDRDSVIQCVKTTDRSHTAMFHGNLWGIHLELCGTVQTRAQWLDAASRPTIRNAAAIAARCMLKWDIPPVRKTTTQLRDPAAKGVCGHVDWTKGWPEDGGSHTDPGPEFPWDLLFTDLTDFLEGDMATVDEIWNAEHIPNFKYSRDGTPLTQEQIAANPTFQADNSIALIGEIVSRDAGRITQLTKDVEVVKAVVTGLSTGGINVDDLVAKLVPVLAPAVAEIVFPKLKAAAQAEADALG